MPLTARKASVIPAVLAILSSICLGQTLQTVAGHGPSQNRVDVVILGDGYTAGELDAFAGHVTNWLHYTFGGSQDPFPRYEQFFNVHRVDIASQQSGADVPNEGIYVNTALGASYGSGAMDRLLTVNTSLVNSAVNAALSGTGITSDLTIVAVNSGRYGGSGGSVSVFAAGNSSYGEVALHEMGHTFGRLADEYYSSGTYGGSEPYEPNVTKDPAGAKWAHWIGYDDPANSLSPVGVYEGARYYSDGLYRPTTDSKMKSLGKPFNAVSREALILEIYNDVDVLDDWLGSAAGDHVTLHNPAALWVDTVDPAVVRVDWFLNGAPTSFHGESLDLFAAGIGPGQYTIEALARDATDWVRKDLHKLEHRIVFDVTLEWLTGDLDGDGDVDFADFIALSKNFGLSVDPYANGDLDGDGIVAAADLTLLKQQLGTRLESGLQVVPEPTSLALLGLLAPAAARRRRRCPA